MSLYISYGQEVMPVAQITATITDAADIRALDCVMPDYIKVSRLSKRLAELMHLPPVGPDDYPINYGLIIKGGYLLDPEATLAETDLPKPLTLRIVPEIAAAQDEIDTFGEPMTGEEDESELDEFEIETGEQIALIHDDILAARPDVRIDAAVHKKIEAFARKDRHTECAGLLLGTVDCEDTATVIHISAIAPAEAAEGTRTSVRLTLEAWESMLWVRDHKYGHLRVIGWFHTHAGWGVFLSDPDVFIHRHFFPHPNMVAYVLDPTSGSDGFYFWHEGKISPCPNYGLVGTADEIQLHKNETQAKAARGRRPDLRDAIIGLLVLLVLGLGFAAIPLGRAHHHREKPRQRTAAVKPPEHVKDKPAVTDKPAPPADKTYAIASGDNPWSICNRIYKNGDLGTALMRYNGLPPNPRLSIGQQIKLPSKEKLEKLAGH